MSDKIKILNKWLASQMERNLSYKTL